MRTAWIRYWKVDYTAELGDGDREIVVIQLTEEYDQPASKGRKIYHEI